MHSKVLAITMLLKNCSQSIRSTSSSTTRHFLPSPALSNAYEKSATTRSSVKPRSLVVPASTIANDESFGPERRGGRRRDSRGGLVLLSIENFDRRDEGGVISVLLLVVLLAPLFRVRDGLIAHLPPHAVPQRHADPRQERDGVLPDAHSLRCRADVNVRTMQLVVEERFRRGSRGGSGRGGVMPPETIDATGWDNGDATTNATGRPRILPLIRGTRARTPWRSSRLVPPPPTTRRRESHLRRLRRRRHHRRVLPRRAAFSSPPLPFTPPHSVGARRGVPRTMTPGPVAARGGTPVSSDTTTWLGSSSSSSSSSSSPRRVLLMATRP